MNRFFYTLIFHLALPFIALRLWWRGRQMPAYRARIAERFAYKLPTFKTGGIWLHAVSVGESIAAAPLVRALQQQYPNTPITITCMTPTGSERIHALFNNSVQHCYLPYDLPWTVNRFLNKLKPSLAIVMETELWPNYIQACKSHHIPMILANARLSARSARGYARFSALTQPMLKNLYLIAAQTEVEATRFRELGATSVVVTGSIKFDLTVPEKLKENARSLRKSWNAQDRFIWIAASTHQGEDEIILDAHHQILRQHPESLLIIVPRHPERFPNVYKQCIESGFNTVCRSKNEVVQINHHVLLGDSMGELLFLYALADIAFVGGSLIKRGGHNLLEPAALGVPIITGPYVFNFLEVANLLEEANALEKVENAEKLALSVSNLIKHKEKLSHQGQSALTVLKANQGALKRLLEQINKIYPTENI